MKLVFIPLLALVAAYSVEAAFEAYSVLNITEVGKPSFYNKFNYTVTLVDADGNVKPNNANLICPIADFVLGNATCKPISYSNNDYLSVKFDTTNITFVGDLAPQHMIARVCYSLVSSTLRKWRKFNDKFHKDKHCAVFGGNIVKKAPFALGPQELRIKMPDNTPDAFMSVEVMFRCWGQSTEDFCAGSDTMRKAKMFFNTKAIESIPSSMTVMTFIFASIGPLFFVVWEFMRRVANAKRS